MTASRARRLRALKDRIGARSLIWLGVRGTDADALLDLPQFDRCFSIIAPLGASSLAADLSLETLKRHRVDLNTYSTDNDPSAEVGMLLRELRRACARPSVLVTYRPGSLLTPTYFPFETVQYLGLFPDQQAVFEHKPWAERELHRAGVRVVPWRYLNDDDLEPLAEALKRGPQLVRSARSSGGVGFVAARTLEDIPSTWRTGGRTLLSYAPCLVPNVPLNVSGVVFPDGSVTLHAPSVQLIGIPSCTNRPLGYCGNDYARVRDLDPSTLDDLEAIATAVGRWLHRAGYLGTFGVDAIAHDGNVHFSEVNPRFQGTSALSAWLAAQLDLPDLYSEHIAAFIGMEAPRMPRLLEQACAQARLAQVLCYNRAAGNVSLRDGADPPQEARLLPDRHVTVAPEGALFRVVLPGPVTEDGSAIDPQAARLVASCAAQFTLALPLESTA